MHPLPLPPLLAPRYNSCGIAVWAFQRFSQAGRRGFEPHRRSSIARPSGGGPRGELSAFALVACLGFGGTSRLGRPDCDANFSHQPWSYGKPCPPQASRDNIVFQPSPIGVYRCRPNQPCPLLSSVNRYAQVITRTTALVSWGIPSLENRVARSSPWST